LFQLKVDDKTIFVKFKLKDFVFDGQECSMVIIEDRTSQKIVDKLEFNNKMVKMHASCVSHDMRSPISAINHVIDMVLNIPEVSKKIVKLLKPVFCASKILKVQINNLLDYNLLQKTEFKVNT
jgi:K+-sensing histidine kinase KdpD